MSRTKQALQTASLGKAAAPAKAVKTPSMAKPPMLPIEVQLERCMWANLLILALCAGMAGFVFSSKRQDLLLAYKTTGDVYVLPYSDQPQLSSEAVTNWAVQALTAIYNYDMNNVEQRLITSSDYFTLEGWLSFTQAIGKSNFVDNVKRSRQIVTSVTAAPPVVVWEEDKNGVHRWGVSVTLRISVDSGQAKPRSDNSSIMLTIERIPTSESPGGYALGIVKLG